MSGSALGGGINANFLEKEIGGAVINVETYHAGGSRLGSFNGDALDISAA